MRLVVERMALSHDGIAMQECRASSAVAVEEPWMVWLESDSNRHPYGSDTRSE